MDAEYILKFELTERQKKISEELCRCIDEGRDVLLERVCGRGKTELVFEVISRQLRKGRRVGFAIARRQVVLEIAGRLQKSFPDLKVVPVCQGHTTDIYGDITVCTTHQLFRFPHYFDLLIIDPYGILGLNS